MASYRVLINALAPRGNSPCLPDSPGPAGSLLEGKHVEEVVEPLLRGPTESLADLVAVFGVAPAQLDSGFEAAGARQAFEGFHSRRNPAGLPSRDG